MDVSLEFSAYIAGGHKKELGPYFICPNISVVV
jgi:hypothetical protein